jgi:DNA polymerase (family X)
MRLHEAYGLAERIKAELAQWCERIEIAGSIRRARPEVNDIDLVVLPKPGDAEALRARCKQRSRVLQDGPQNLIVQLPERAGSPGMQLDVFFAHGVEADLLASKPSNWGSLLLCRTGSKEHNIRIAQRCQSMGLKWEIYRGVVGPGGAFVAGETEEEIFKALGMEFIPPALREA